METDGKHHSFERPVVVIYKFNKEMFWGIPLTSKEHIGKYYAKNYSRARQRVGYTFAIAHMEQ